ncbi:MAG: monovalent cation/H+ antiporter complex subunit F [bacterium]|nr:monovalent cation/H+ antiporter complex subunit F [bacterium]
MIEFSLVLKFAMMILSITIFFCLYRALIGPTIPDRIIGINLIGTKNTVMIVFAGVLFNENGFFDIALLYAMLAFITNIALVKYMETEK